MKVYDPNGNEQEMDAVDARECVEHCGYSLTPPETETETETGETEAAKPAKAKKA